MYIAYQDLLYVISSIAIAVVSVFLCWALYQLAILLKQANEMVTETRDKVTRVEDIVVNLAEKIGTVSKYLSFLTEGGKQVLSMVRGGGDDEEDEPVKKTKKRGKILSNWKE